MTKNRVFIDSSLSYLMRPGGARRAGNTGGAGWAGRPGGSGGADLSRCSGRAGRPCGACCACRTGGASADAAWAPIHTERVWIIISALVCLIWIQHCSLAPLSPFAWLSVCVSAVSYRLCRSPALRSSSNETGPCCKLQQGPVLYLYGINTADSSRSEDQTGGSAQDGR